MNVAEIIAHKRDGKELTSDEIGELIGGYAAGEIPDYQMAAWAMAVCLRGMQASETTALTTHMLASGHRLPPSDPALRVDKHSTGGVGDKTSFIIAPLLACCGLQVPMISGRGLGATGGTLDKLESIPGLRTDLSAAEAQAIVETVGCVITSASAELVPADHRLYALRDVTGTVPSIPLITASILSKKLAENLSALVLDVKFGSGAFMKTIQTARALAKSLVAVGEQMGLPTTALLTAMDQPLGRMAGGGVEIDESLATLSGGGPDDLRALALALAAEVLLMKGLATDARQASSILRDHMASGRALEKFRQMVTAQGGNLDAPRVRAPAWTLTARQSGVVASMDAERLGLAIVELGGGRKKAHDPIDRSVGLEMLVRLGERVECRQPLMQVFAPAAAHERAMRLIEGAITIGPQAPAAMPLVAERITALGMLPFAIDVDATRRRLIDAAMVARRRAYAPYSGFQVGAALLTASNRIYEGSNVENASYGLTICAERVAISTAVAAGETNFLMLAVASDVGATPCGACRQFAAEFCTDLPILLVDVRNASQPVEMQLAELLPGGFKLPRQIVSHPVDSADTP